MFEVLFRSVVLIASAILWLSGLRLFLHATLSRRRRLVWTACLVATGGIIGLLLSRSQVWEKFLILLALLPALGLADMLLLRSRRGWSFWIRACGFELGTVFGMASITRLVCDKAGIVGVLGGSR
jgi:hypothetical protein